MGCRFRRLGTSSPGRALAAPGDEVGEADMDRVARVRQASIKIGRIQRRVWLIQTLFWPVALVAGIVAVVVVVAVGRLVWRRRATVVGSEPAAAAAAGNGVVVSAAPAESRLNTASSGNHSG